jgi:hypothetical protein
MPAGIHLDILCINRETIEDKEEKDWPAKHIPVHFESSKIRNFAGSFPARQICASDYRQVVRVTGKIPDTTG